PYTTLFRSISTASTRVSSTRTALPSSRTCRRRHRSSSGPANGPTIVNGSSSTANAAATAPAVARFSGEKKNRVASPAWNMPSPHWDTRRTANNFRKSRCTATVRRSVHIFTWRRLSRYVVATAASRPAHLDEYDGGAHRGQVRSAVIGPAVTGRSSRSRHGEVLRWGPVEPRAGQR